MFLSQDEMKDGVVILIRERVEVLEYIDLRWLIHLVYSFPVRIVAEINILLDLLLDLLYGC